MSSPSAPISSSSSSSSVGIKKPCLGDKTFSSSSVPVSSSLVVGKTTTNLNEKVYPTALSGRVKFNVHLYGAEFEEIPFLQRASCAAKFYETTIELVVLRRDLAPSIEHQVISMDTNDHAHYENTEDYEEVLQRFERICNYHQLIPGGLGQEDWAPVDDPCAYYLDMNFGIKLNGRTLLLSEFMGPGGSQEGYNFVSNLLDGDTLDVNYIRNPDYESEIKAKKDRLDRIAHRNSNNFNRQQEENNTNSNSQNNSDINNNNNNNSNIVDNNNTNHLRSRKRAHSKV